MTKRKNVFERAKAKLYDHPVLRRVLNSGWAYLVVTLSAFLFAFGFRTFMAPSNAAQLETSGSLNLVGGGVSGISQTIIQFVDLVSGHSVSQNNLYSILYSILYFGLNIPVFIVGWIGVGKRFTILTLINVAEVSLFNYLLGFADEALFFKIADFVDQNGGLVTRALLAGVCTGVSSAIAYKVDASAGGIDVIAYYIALKKSQLVGRYSVYINIATVTLYTLIVITDAGWGTDKAAQLFVATLFSVLYMLVVMLVIDLINLRNKKVRIEAVTANPDLGKIIMANIPHGATLIHGEGAYTGQEKYIFEIVISTYEIKETVKVIREADPGAFVQLIELKQVYGRFFLPPVR